MKKYVWMVLAVVMASMCVLVAGCTGSQEEPEATVSRTFLAGYETEQLSGRVLMNLMNDGTAEFYVATLTDGVHSTARFDGTYTFGENEEYDETISFEYTYGDGQTVSVTDAVIIDHIFEAQFCLVDTMTESQIKFYETAPASTDGDVYVGYLTKTGGMGAMVYAYSLCLKDDNTFDVSIMQMASVMHVWGGTGGTYTMDGDAITFIYDILSTEGEVLAEDQISEGSGYTDTTLSTAFNIAQTSMKASEASFIRVK